MKMKTVIVCSLAWVLWTKTSVEPDFIPKWEPESAFETKTECADRLRAVVDFWSRQEAADGYYLKMHGDSMVIRNYSTYKVAVSHSGTCLPDTVRP
jgi:hypothetical protein